MFPFISQYVSNITRWSLKKTILGYKKSKEDRHSFLYQCFISGHLKFYFWSDKRSSFWFGFDQSHFLVSFLTSAWEQHSLLLVLILNIIIIFLSFFLDADKLVTTWLWIICVKFFTDQIKMNWVNLTGFVFPSLCWKKLFQVKIIIKMKCKLKLNN